MALGRILGWFLVCLAITLGSADAVLALDPGGYQGIATGHLLTLLAGYAPGTSESGTSFSEVIDIICRIPAWVVLSLAGSFMLLACRPRRRRRYKAQQA